MSLAIVSYADDFLIVHAVLSAMPAKKGAHIDKDVKMSFQPEGALFT